MKSPSLDASSEHYLFSTRALYESWGDQLGFNITWMNKITDRLHFVADSTGIIPNEGNDAFVIPQWYLTYQESLLTNAIPQTTSTGLCYTSMRLVKDMCNPDMPPGAPFSCSGNFNITTFSPVVGGFAKPVMPIMNNIASAWIPRRIPLCNSPVFAHLRAFNKPFFFQRIRTMTVNITDGLSDLFVPFANIYSDCDNRISSFITWGSSNL
jgi:hypothetical protein